MWLVLCNDDDVAALWAWAGLVDRGLAPLELVTTQALASARRWAHFVTDEGSAVEMTLADGRTIDSRSVHGVLNRLVSVWNAWNAHALVPDREYASQEFYAFFISWLACLPGPVFNRPTFMGPGGQWRHDSEWAFLASRAGLAGIHYRMPAASPAPAVSHPPRGGRQQVVVFGGEAFGAPAPGSVVEGCRRLSELSATELLGVEFEVGDDGIWCFRTATPRPDLRLGGSALLDALAHRLAPAEISGR